MSEVQRNPSANKVDPKLSQFSEELNDLCDKYQYNLKPQLRTTVNGIVPTLNIVNKVPPKKSEIKKPSKKSTPRKPTKK